MNCTGSGPVIGVKREAIHGLPPSCETYPWRGRLPACHTCRDGQPALIQAESSSRRHRTRRPSRTGSGIRPELWRASHRDREMPHIAAAARASSSAASTLLGTGASTVPTAGGSVRLAAIAATAVEIFVEVSVTAHLLGILPVLLPFGRLRRTRQRWGLGCLGLLPVPSWTALQSLFRGGQFLCGGNYSLHRNDDSMLCPVVHARVIENRLRRNWAANGKVRNRAICGRKRPVLEGPSPLVESARQVGKCVTVAAWAGPW